MLTVKQLQQRNVFEVIVRKSVLQEMADFSVYPGDFRLYNLETGRNGSKSGGSRIIQES